MTGGLTTQRLMLRPARPSDADQAHAMATDFEVVRHTATWPWPADPAFTAARCEGSDQQDDLQMVALKGDQLVGMIGIKQDGDLGYMIARPFWGHGYASEIGRAVIAHVAAQGIWEQLKACVFDDNPASARVLEKLGFVEGPVCTGHCRARGGDCPTRTFTRTLPRA